MTLGAGPLSEEKQMEPGCRVHLCLAVYEVTDSVGRTGGCVSEVLVCFQPTQGQLGSNRDATLKLSPSAFLPPFQFTWVFRSPCPSLPLEGGVLWGDECLAFCFN